MVNMDRRPVRPYPYVDHEVGRAADLRALLEDRMVDYHRTRPLNVLCSTKRGRCQSIFKASRGPDDLYYRHVTFVGSPRPVLTGHAEVAPVTILLPSG